MNGLRPPLTAPPGFAVRQSRSDSKECCRPALLFREGEFPWQTRKPIKNISSAGTTPLARLLSAVPDSVRPCRNYVELHIILLYFPAFCDTILILINFTAENSRWNINIFAKVFPAKSPQIHPTISEFAEDRWFMSGGRAVKACGMVPAEWDPGNSYYAWLKIIRKGALREAENRSGALVRVEPEKLTVEAVSFHPSGIWCGNRVFCRIRISGFLQCSWRHEALLDFSRIQNYCIAYSYTDMCK